MRSVRSEDNAAVYLYLEPLIMREMKWVPLTRYILDDLYKHQDNRHRKLSSDPINSMSAIPRSY